MGMSPARALLLASLLLAGCGQQATPPPSGPMPVTVVTVRRGEVNQSAVASGQVEGIREVEVRARVTGILLAVDYKEGAAVKAGDLLFRIDPAPYKAAFDLAMATLRQETARATQARAEADRQAKLLAAGATGKREAEDAAAAAVAAEAARDAAAAKARLAELDLGYCEIRSPIDGVANRRLRTEGSLVSPGGSDGLLTTVVQSGQVWVRFGLSEPEFYRLFKARAEAAAGATVRVLLPDGSYHPVVGKVDFAATEVDTHLGSVQMRAHFDNADGSLIRGQFARVEVAGLKVPGFMIPQEALVQIPRGRIVFVASAGKAEARSVALGDPVDADIAVLSGLAEGDQVIVDQLQKLRPGAPVAPHPSAK